MKRSAYIESNCKAWNEVEPKHRRQHLARLKQDFSSPKFSCLDEIVTDLFQRIGIEGATIGQLCCNNGRELLSLKNLGARKCVGFDISAEFIVQARELADTTNIDCEFVETDVYRIARSFNNRFDIVFTTVGVLGWLPELAGFIEVVRRILKPSGSILIYEQHPIVDMFTEEQNDAAPKLKRSYFRTEPFVDNDGLDYYNHGTYDSETLYWFHHQLADIINGLASAGFHIDSFAEYDHDLSLCYSQIASMATRPPLSFSLIAQKQ